MDKDTLVLYAARASRTENQDAIDASIVGMLSDPKEVLIEFQIDVFYEHSWKLAYYCHCSLLWHLRQEQESMRCISCPSIQWTSAQQSLTLMPKAVGTEAARVLLSK